MGKLFEFLHLAGALMKYLFEGIALLGFWFINPNEKSINKYKSSLKNYFIKALEVHFLQGNLPLRLLRNAKLSFMSCE